MCLNIQINCKINYFLVMDTKVFNNKMFGHDPEHIHKTYFLRCILILFSDFSLDSHLFGINDLGPPTELYEMRKVR
jgi:hypothetical protein